MNTSNVNWLMGQQLNAIKDLEELISHDESKQPATHAIKQEDINLLKNYISTMKTACNTAVALAKHYTEEKKPEEKPAAEAPKPSEPKPKKSSAKKSEPIKEVTPVDAEEEFDFLD